MHPTTVFGVVSAQNRGAERIALRVSLWPGQPTRADPAAEPGIDAHRRDLAAGGDEFARRPSQDRGVLGPVHESGTGASWRQAGGAPGASRPGPVAVAPAQSSADAPELQLPP